MARSETSFRVNKVLPFLKTLKHTTYFPIQQMSIVGDPDYMLCIRGAFVALELKRAGKEPRPKQQEKLDKVRDSGGIAIVASETNWAEVKILLSLLDETGAKP